jgi:hypothetical protein
MISRTMVKLAPGNGLHDEPLLLVLPVLGAPLMHAPLLRWDLAPWLAKPLDLGLVVRGTPLFGRNKTIRGAMAMTCGPLVATVGLSKLPAYWERVPEPARQMGPFQLGLRLGLGTSLGELPNSFIKRRLGVPPGGSAHGTAKWLLAVFDQADFLPVLWALLWSRWRISPREAARCFVVVVLVHLIQNVIGWALGLRERPL